MMLVLCSLRTLMVVVKASVAEARVCSQKECRDGKDF